MRENLARIVGKRIPVDMLERHIIFCRGEQYHIIIFHSDTLGDQRIESVKSFFVAEFACAQA